MKSWTHILLFFFFKWPIIHIIVYMDDLEYIWFKAAWSDMKFP